MGQQWAVPGAKSLQAARNALLFPWSGLCFAAIGDTEGAKVGEK